jgi:hypothetical protein
VSLAEGDEELVGARAGADAGAEAGEGIAAAGEQWKEDEQRDAEGGPPAAAGAIEGAQGRLQGGRTGLNGVPAPAILLGFPRTGTVSTHFTRRRDWTAVRSCG